MLRTYFSYSLTLLTAFMVWWIFGLFATVAASYTWLPFVAFLASTIHFGISSWVFLIFPKAGRILSIVTGLSLCTWPIGALFSSFNEDIFSLIYFLFVIGLTAALLYNHIKTFRDLRKPKPITRLILSVIPFGLFILYVATTYKYFVWWKNCRQCRLAIVAFVCAQRSKIKWRWSACEHSLNSRCAASSKPSFLWPKCLSGQYIQSSWWMICCFFLIAYFCYLNDLRFEN